MIQIEETIQHFPDKIFIIGTTNPNSSDVGGNPSMTASGDWAGVSDYPAKATVTGVLDTTVNTLTSLVHWVVSRHNDHDDQADQHGAGQSPSVNLSVISDPPNCAKLNLNTTILFYVGIRLFYTLYVMRVLSFQSQSWRNTRISQF
jgi:hypothetical protein